MIGEEAMVQVTLTVPREMRDRIEAYTKELADKEKSNVSISAATRKLLSVALNEHDRRRRK